MIVFHVIDKLIGGGAEKQLRILVNNSSNLVQHKVVYLKKGGEKLINPPTELIRIEATSKIEIIKKLNIVFKRNKLDILQVWLPEYFCIFAIFVARRYHKGLHIISCDRRAPVNRFSYLYLRDRIKILQHFMSDIIVANFPIQKYGRFSRFLLKKRPFFNVYNAIEFGEAAVGWDNSSTVNIIFVGRLVFQKQPLKVLVLLQKLHTVFPQYNFFAHFFGEGELQEALCAYSVNNSLIKNTKFHGFVQNWKNEVRCMEGMKIMYFPTQNEGMPNVLFEAASIELPFVSSDIQEIVVHFGHLSTKEFPMLVNPSKDNDSKTIEAFEKILFDREFVYRVNKKNLRSIYKYNVNGYVSKWFQLYKELAK